jgi:hypothetical protein
MKGYDLFSIVVYRSGETARNNRALAGRVFVEPRRELMVWISQFRCGGVKSRSAQPQR